MAAAVVIGAAAGASCDPSATRSEGDSSKAEPTPSIQPSTSPASTTSTPSATFAAAPASAPRPPNPRGKLEILKLRFTSKIQNKEPKDSLDFARPGERAYAHLVVRNRTGDSQKLTAVFRVGDAIRARVGLDIAHSWSFRTWAYATVKPGDKGKLDLTIEDETGDVIAESGIPIR